MNETSPAEPKPSGPVPADDPGRVLTHVSPTPMNRCLTSASSAIPTRSLCPAPTPLGATR